VQIGSSLAAALRHVRHEHKQVTIWADALCINQGDTEEKNWQIPLMRQIYSNATTVHAWLGPRYDTSPDVISSVTAAFDLIAIMGDLLKRLDCMQELANETSWSRACFTLAKPRVGYAHQAGNDAQKFWAAKSERLYDTLVSNNLWDRYLYAMQTLSQLEYFRRMWVLQEIGRARSLTFHYAEREAPYKMLFFSLCLARGFCAAGFDSRVLVCLTARLDCNLNHSIKEVLELAYWQQPPMNQASNPRDLIYALLGLASGPTVIDVRYDLNVEDAYVSATRLLLKWGFTDILWSFKPYISSRVVSSETFPSWAYDWSTRGTSSFGKYAACGSTELAISIEKGPSLDGNNVITLRGRRCGFIVATSDSFSEVANAAGLTPEVIRTGNIRLQPPSAEGEQTLGERIRREYQQLLVHVGITNIEGLFNSAPFSVGLFWIWWIKWVSKLWNLAERTIASGNQHDCIVRESVLNLLLRNALPDLNGLSKAKSLHDLIDPRFWTNTSLESRASQRPSFVAGDGDGHSVAEPVSWPSIEAVQSLFHSAWGMRPLALKGDVTMYRGHLGYGPESTTEDDEIVIFDGVAAPLVLREDDEAATAYKIIGPTYVSGIMKGQFMGAGVPGQEYVLV